MTPGRRRGSEMKHTPNDTIYKLIEQRDGLLEACKEAFTLSCLRAESRKKWTIRDQAVHDMLKHTIAKAEGRE